MIWLLEVFRENHEFVRLLLWAAARQDGWLQRLSLVARIKTVQALLKCVQMPVYPFI